MSERQISFDQATLDQKILVDDDESLVMQATIASEIVHRYEDGWAYKPADELKKMAETASRVGAVPVKILGHPSAETYSLLLSHADINGRAENFRYVKNLIDPKTKRPNRRGVKADIRWFKDLVPDKVLEETRTGLLKDVSIGFTHDKDWTKGEWNGTTYDYAQRNIFLQHVAAPIEAGRCPGPICGIGFDRKPVVAADPYGEYESFEDCVAKNTGKEGVADPEAFCEEFRTKPGEPTVQPRSDIKNCVICKEIERVGLVRASYRLKQYYGADVIQVITGKQRRQSVVQDQTLEELLLDSKRARESVRWLFE